jgi:hypothetical protein
MDKAAARHVTSAMLDCGRLLGESVRHVEEAATPDDFLAYREIVSRLLFTMLVEVLNPMFAEHPELKPEGWHG